MDTPWEQIPDWRCWELLATASVGRLALSVRALPVILPVHYHIAGFQVTACLGHRAIPERSLNHAIVAFSADAIHSATRTGWSVQVQGRTTVPRHDGFDTACGQLTAGQLIEIHPASITGYHVHPCPFIDALHAGH